MLNPRRHLTSRDVNEVAETLGIAKSKMGVLRDKVVVLTRSGKVTLSLELTHTENRERGRNRLLRDLEQALAE